MSTVGKPHWLLLDESGEILTREKTPKLATVQAMVNEQGLNLGLGKQFFVVPAKNSMKRLVQAKIADKEIELALEADLFSHALSQYLGVNCRLVRLTPENQSFIDPQSVKVLI